MASIQSRKTLALTPEGDLKKNELNRLEWVYGADAVVVEMKTTIATIQGEDPFDSEHGLDVFGATGGNENALRLEIVEALMREHGDVIQKINEVDIEIDDNRIAHVAIDVSLIEDERVTVEV